MIQALVKKGRVIPTHVPAPTVSDNGLLIKVVNSCISAGTELTGIQKSKESLIKKALIQPEKVLKLMNTARSEGIAKAFSKIKDKTNESKPTGYSVSGIVIGCGKNVKDIKPGDRVAAAGAGIANHAEYVDVPRNLTIPFPENLAFAAASTVTLGGIALQGVRRANVALGEFVVVTGVGIIGQLAVQILCASGARVIAIDLDDKRLSLACELGAEVGYNPSNTDSARDVFHYTGGHGADVTLFCAATDQPEALSKAFEMTRKKGRLVMVGVWGQTLKREDIYKKELDFFISTSYGPGRYDDNYEKKTLDYPYAYIRWTENRNMTEYLRLLSSGKIDVEKLVECNYPIEDCEKAFELIQSSQKPLMVLLDYGESLPTELSMLDHKTQIAPLTQKPSGPPKNKKVRVGIIGAGSFAVGMHIPNLLQLSDKYTLHSICSRTGSNAQNLAQRFNCKNATTNYMDILSDPEIDLVMICTRHNLHGKIVLESLNLGKHTFVEKPLCTTENELEKIINFFHEHPVEKDDTPLLTVGFNRRFSKYATEIKRHTAKRINPLIANYRMNAGYQPMDHWVHSDEGGGRIIGESCHIIDLFSFLIGSPIRNYSCSSLTPATESVSPSDNKMVTMEYDDGSMAHLEYFSIGSKEVPKEQMEIHFDNKSIVLTDYKSLTGYNIHLSPITSTQPEKGQLEELKELYSYLNREKNAWPISLASLIETTRLTFQAA